MTDRRRQSRKERASARMHELARNRRANEIDGTTADEGEGKAIDENRDRERRRESASEARYRHTYERGRRTVDARGGRGEHRRECTGDPDTNARKRDKGEVSGENETVRQM